MKNLLDYLNDTLESLDIPPINKPSPKRRNLSTKRTIKKISLNKED